MHLSDELDGILVISLEQAVAAPYCGLMLANSGARVIKVERPEGDFARGYDDGANGKSAIFAWLNRGKESICLNLKDPSDLAVMQRMLHRADVFLSNLSPGAIERMGLDYATLSQTNPGLICCSISGYGETGPASQKKAYDFLIQAEAGICAVTGTQDAPARVGISVSDLSTGMTAYSGILRALIQRGKTGRGAKLSISMFDVAADWMNIAMLTYRFTGVAPARTGLQHSFIAPYGAFTCKGGAQALLSVQNNREWVDFCTHVLHQPHFATDPRFVDNPDRYTNRVALDAIVNACFGQLPIKEVLDRLDTANVANARLNSVAELSEHPLVRNVSAQFGDEMIDMAGLPVPNHSGEPLKVPTLGAQSSTIRTEFSD